mmetsp:Transcript_3321/g.12047  ORF Transcript_3321/g.12047 Transcript_3321/m.12047 type:complete len:138 (-) Transcript_3321:147-560(-)
MKVKLDAGKVIRGWTLVLPTMCKGEMASVRIAPEYAYGAEGTEGVPAGATLEFDIEMVATENSSNDRAAQHAAAEVARLAGAKADRAAQEAKRKEDLAIREARKKEAQEKMAAKLAAKQGGKKGGKKGGGGGKKGKK